MRRNAAHLRVDLAALVGERTSAVVGPLCRVAVAGVRVADEEQTACRTPRLVASSSAHPSPPPRCRSRPGSPARLRVMVGLHRKRQHLAVRSLDVSRKRVDAARCCRSLPAPGPRAAFRRTGCAASRPPRPWAARRRRWRSRDAARMKRSSLVKASGLTRFAAGEPGAVLQRELGRVDPHRVDQEPALHARALPPTSPPGRIAGRAA